MNDEYVKEEEVEELEGRTSGSIPPIAHTKVNSYQRYEDLWGNCCVEIEALKVAFEKSTTHIVKDMRTELNARNVGGDLYKAVRGLDEIKASNESYLIHLVAFPGMIHYPL